MRTSFTSNQVKMNQYLLVFFMLTTSLSFSQGIKSGVVKARNVEWVVVPYNPYMTVRAEVDLNRSDLLVVLNCDSSFYTIVTPDTFPQDCADELTVNNRNKVDSSGTIYINCVIDHFMANKEKYKIDTVWVDNEWVIEPIKVVGVKEDKGTYFMSRMELYNADSTYRARTEFYSIDELKGVCIKEVFRYKSVESWENGKKHGKWQYYNLEGVQTKEIEYEHGKKIKETTY